MLAVLMGVALLWGCTNPFLKHYSAGIAARRSSGVVADLRFLLLRPGYAASLAVNLLGSVGFYMALSDWPVSVVVPVANSLTFVTTALVGALCFGEQTSARDVLGMVLVVAGVAIAV